MCEVWEIIGISGCAIDTAIFKHWITFLQRYLVLTWVSNENIFLRFSGVTRLRATVNSSCLDVRRVKFHSKATGYVSGAYVSGGPWRMKNSVKPIDRNHKDSFLSLLVPFISHTAYSSVEPHGPDPVFLPTARKWNLAVERWILSRPLMQFLQATCINWNIINA